VIVKAEDLFRHYLDEVLDRLPSELALQGNHAYGGTPE
jgi:hypothetical protein